MMRSGHRSASGMAKSAESRRRAKALRAAMERYRKDKRPKVESVGT